MAVKVQKPDLARVIERDFALLTAVASGMERLPGMGSTPLQQTVAEWHRAIADQLNFPQEARFHRLFAENLGSIDGILVPTLVPELSSDAVLVMEYMDDLHPLDDESMSPEVRRRAANCARSTK